MWQVSYHSSMEVEQGNEKRPFQEGMEVQASPATKQAVASLTALGINPMMPKKKPPTAEEAAAVKAQAELRKRARESEQAEETAAMDLEDSEHTLATPGSARRLIKQAADARAQRKIETSASIKKTRAEDAEVPPPEASAEPATGSKQITPTPKPAAGHRIKRKNNVENKSEKTKTKKKKVLPKTVEEPEEEQEQPVPAPQSAPKVHAPPIQHSARCPLHTRIPPQHKPLLHTTNEAMVSPCLLSGLRATLTEHSCEVFNLYCYAVPHNKHSLLPTDLCQDLYCGHGSERQGLLIHA